MPTKTEPPKTLVVGIGASAGGLEAFKSFFANLPSDSGMAFVLVQHLSPDHKSLLAELVARSTTMPVVEAANDMAVVANRVFVIPPDATMTIRRGRLRVVRPAPPRESRRPIDTFLGSLAEDLGERAIGIILSGTGSDGAHGLAAIKEHGGLTLAQAEYDSHALPGMPQSAAATGRVDDVLAVEAMPARLTAHQRHLVKVAGAKDDDGVRQDAGSQLAPIMVELRARSGHDFSEYKERTLTRRVQRRMQVLQVATPEAYLASLRDKPEELDLLFHELLIGVTQFFRDPAAFEALDAAVLKPLMKGKGADDEIRVWVPGCATGEEAFTLAILLREAMSDRRPKPRVQIFATDIDDRAIAAARQGRFRAPVAGLSPERLERWFTPDGHYVCVRPEIREMCVFSTHSVIKHPPFSKLDLISCRNLLIYLDPALQSRVMHTFHYALKPAGHLFLGSSESVTRTTDLFAAEDKKARIFARRAVVERALPDVRLPDRRVVVAREPDAKSRVSDDRIDVNARRIMEKYYPPHVVVDRRYQIVRFSGGEMGRYLEPSAGRPSFGLFDILRKPLRPAVRAALHLAEASNAPVRREHLSLRIDGQNRLVTLIVEPMTPHAEDGGLIVLAFQDDGHSVRQGKPGPAGQEMAERVKALEQELLTTRTQLQSSVDEYETVNEEMKSSNEEYQSVNEELQSTNEEMETAKEEMQSVNEELQTMNAEMVSKNEQLTTLNSDISNLLESTEIATLFLDDQLRVRSFTRGVSEIFHMRDSDVGRPIAQIVSLLHYPELEADVKGVIRKLVVSEREVALRDHNMTFNLRIRPYRTVDNLISGVVMTFLDITARQTADRSLRESEQQFHALAESIPQLAWIMDADGGIYWFNRRWFDYTSTTLEKMRGWGWRDVLHPDETDRVVSRLKHSIKTGELWEDTFPLRAADGQYRWFLSRAEPIRDASDQIVRWFGTNTDIEDQRRDAEQQALLLRELDHRVKNLFAIVGGVVTLSARTATTPKQMAETVQGRLGALAKAHLLIQGSGSGTQHPSSVEALVSAILAPYQDPAAPPDTRRATLDGPDVPLSGEAVTSLALVLHELATNAAKYGALSTPEGRVLISWRIVGAELELTWRERGGPPVSGPPAREGFGSLLARRSIGGQLGGRMTFDWAAEGLTVHMCAARERLTP